MYEWLLGGLYAQFLLVSRPPEMKILPSITAAPLVERRATGRGAFRLHLFVETS
jgi:hypothetical protein